MPRKPSSFFLITETRGNLSVQRIPLIGDETMEGKAPGYYHTQGAGTMVYVVEDTKVVARKVKQDYEDVDDPRLPDQPPDEELHTP